MSRKQSQGVIATLLLEEIKSQNPISFHPLRGIPSIATFQKKQLTKTAAKVSIPYGESHPSRHKHRTKNKDIIRYRFHPLRGIPSIATTTGG